MEIPHNHDAERQVIGCIIKHPAALDEISLAPEDFYFPKHQHIYKTLQQMHTNLKKIDLITVSNEIPELGTDLAYITGEVVSVANIAHYAEIVREKSKLRKIITLGKQIQRLSFTEEKADDIMQQVEKLVYDLTSQRTSSDIYTAKQVTESYLSMIDEITRKGGGLVGLDTGFTDLNFITSGLQNQDLIIIAARPSMGKTALALNIAYHAAVRKKVPTVIFSLEMRKEKLLQRIISAEARIDSQKLKLAKLTDEEWRRMAKVSNTIAMAEKTLFIDETPAISAMEILSKCRRIKNQYGLGLVVVDYLGLMAGIKGESRYESVSENTRILKNIARELDCPLVCLSQLNRSVEQRQEKKPMLSDLRETGEIEQTADVVMFIYRDDYYNPRSSNKGIAEIIIAKQRDGATGTVELGWRPEYTKFVNLEKHEMGTVMEGEWPGEVDRKQPVQRRNREYKRAN